MDLYVSNYGCYSFPYGYRESFLSVSVPWVVLSHNDFAEPRDSRLGNEISVNKMQSKARQRFLLWDAPCLLSLLELHGKGWANLLGKERACWQQPKLSQPWPKYKTDSNPTCGLAEPSHLSRTRLKWPPHRIINQEVVVLNHYFGLGWYTVIGK